MNMTATVCWLAKMTISRYLGNGDDELHLVFNFPLMRTERITPSHIRRNQKERLTQLGCTAR